MLDEKIKEVLDKEGPATFMTIGKNGPHLAATWNSYIMILGSEQLLIPVGGLHETEQNLTTGSDVQMIVASKEVKGIHGPGAGYVLKGNARFESSGDYFDLMKSKFSWARAAMVFEPRDIKQLV